MKRSLIFVTLALVVAMPVWGQAAATWTVEPGKAVGPIQLGMTMEQVAQHLTATEYIPRTRQPKFVRYEDGLQVEYDAGKALMITVSKPSVTVKGKPIQLVAPGNVQVGQPWSQVELNYGRSDLSRDLKVARGQARQVYHAYTSRGLGFRTDGPTMVQIDVYPTR